MNEPIDKGYFQDSQVEGNLGHLGLRTRHRGKKKKKKRMMKVVTILEIFLTYHQITS